MNDIPPIGVSAMRIEIEHLRGLALLTTDTRALAAIQTLVDELEFRIKRSADGYDPWPNLEA